MRVLMYDPYYDDYYGAQRSLVALAEGLQRRGFLPVVSTGREGVLSERARESGLRVDVLEVPERVNVFGGAALRAGPAGKLLIGLGMLRYAVRMCGFVRRERVDVLFANDLRSLLFFSLARVLLRKRLVWSVMGGPSFGALSALGALLADEIMPVSRAAVKAIPRRLHRRIERKVVVNYIGIETGRYLCDRDPAERREVRRRHGLPEDALLLGCAGSINHRKGHDVLLAALEEVAAGGAPVHLAVAGTPAGPGSAEFMEELRRTVAERSLPVTFVGWLDDLRDFMSAIDVFVLPSREEALGRVTMEAMASCVPPVVTRAGGSEETVADGESGIVVPPEDAHALAAALRTLVESPERRRAMGRAARRRCLEVFDQEAYVERLAAVLSRPASR